MVVATRQKPKKTRPHHKRHGTHQKRSQHFTKTYWPYLPLLLIVGVGMFINSLWAQTSGVLSYATNMTSSGLLVNTNNERSKSGLSGLAINPKLSQAAQAKANDMASRDYWAHNTPDGEEPWIFINETGYHYQAAGENLAYGFLTSQDAVVGWMNSPGHRANILNGNYTEVGFGIVNSVNFQNKGEETIVVAMYAKPAIVAGASETSASPASEPVAQTEPAAAQASRGQPIAAEKSGNTQNIKVSAVVPGPTKVSRVELATSGAAPWSAYAVSMLAVGLLIIFIARHSLAWHRILIRGEKYILKHKTLDVIIVSGVMIGYLLTRTAGVIQ